MKLTRRKNKKLLCRVFRAKPSGIFEFVGVRSQCGLMENNAPCKRCYNCKFAKLPTISEWQKENEERKKDENEHHA